MLHEPATPVGKDHAGAYKMRLGIWMFIFYLLFYGGFVAVNLLNPSAMGEIVLLGLNLATVYGFALILVALVEALIYDALCRKKEKVLAKVEGAKGGMSKPQNGEGKNYVIRDGIVVIPKGAVVLDGTVI